MPSEYEENQIRAILCKSQDKAGDNFADWAFDTEVFLQNLIRELDDGGIEESNEFDDETNEFDDYTPQKYYGEAGQGKSIDAENVVSSDDITEEYRIKD